MELHHTVDAMLRLHGVLVERFSVGTVNDLMMLSIIGRSPDGIRPSEIARTIRTSNANVTGRLDRLEKRGWIQRSARKGDRRCIPAMLSKEGQRLIQSLAD
jgi:DNA-binding MarR family transcriptional regulator